MTTINFDDVKAQGVITPGVYKAQLVKFEIKPTQAGDSENAVCVFLITEDGDAQGRKLTRSFNLKPTALWSLNEFLSACGLQKPSGNVELEEVLAQCANIEVNLHVTSKDFDGRKVNEIKKVTASQNSFGI